MLVTVLIGCGTQKEAVDSSPPEQSSTTQPEQTQAGRDSGPTKVLKLFAIEPQVVKAVNILNETFESEMPGYTVEATAVPGVAEYNTAMASKLAAGDVPDFMVYQWGTQIQLYAKGGHLMDLTDKGIEDKVIPISSNVNKYNNKVYAYPLDQAVFGFFYNYELAKEYGVDYTPKTLDELLSALKTMKENGLKSPITFPAKDGSGATSFIFCYLHQVIAQKNSNYYQDMLNGKTGWNGPEMNEVLDAYAKVLEYSNEDRLGLDPDGALQRFAKGETAFYVGGTWSTKNLREMNPELNFDLIPPPLVESVDNYVAVSDFDKGISISATTKYPDAALSFYKMIFSEDGGAIMADQLSCVSPVIGAKADYDASIYNVLPLLEEGKYVGFSERVWIPGIKEIMKKNIQEWMAGLDKATALDNLEAEHQRLLDAKPDFIDEFNEMHANN